MQAWDGLVADMRLDFAEAQVVHFAVAYRAFHVTKYGDPALPPERLPGIAVEVHTADQHFRVFREIVGARRKAYLSAAYPVEPADDSIFARSCSEQRWSRHEQTLPMGATRNLARGHRCAGRHRGGHHLRHRHRVGLAGVGAMNGFRTLRFLRACGQRPRASHSPGPLPLCNTAALFLLGRGRRLAGP